MSEIENTGAQASVSEAVSDENKTVPVETAEETKAAPEAESTEEGDKPAESETADTPVEGAEIVETEEEKKTKSALRREKAKAKVAGLEAEVKRLEEQLARINRTQPVPDTLGPRPDRSKYDDETEYAADLAAWKTEERILARQTKANETIQ